MEEEYSQKNKLRDQIRSLRSGNRNAILTTLKELRANGDVSVLPDLFDLLCDQEDDQITSEITSLLSDLKEKEAVPLLAEAIGNPEYAGVTALLVSACWQNGLSYGRYLDTFIEVVFNGTYEAAIEAFTVIEECLGELEQHERDQLVIRVKSQISGINEQKKPLVSEMIKVIDRYHSPASH